MAVTGAKFSFDGTDVTFYDNEAETIVKQYRRGYDLYQVASQRFGLYYTDKGYNVFTVGFRIKYGDYENSATATLKKLETVYNWIDSYGQPEKIKFYYEMLWDTTEWNYVQMFRENMDWMFTSGYEQAEYILPVRFVQTTFGTPGVVYKTLGAA